MVSQVSKSIAVSLLAGFVFSCSSGDPDELRGKAGNGDSQDRQIEPAPTLQEQRMAEDGDVTDPAEEQLPGLYIGIGRADRMVTSPDGIKWTEVNAFDQAIYDAGSVFSYNAICRGDNHEVLAVGGGGGTLNGKSAVSPYGKHSRDGGRTWTTLSRLDHINQWWSTCLYGPDGNFILGEAKNIETLLQDDVFSPLTSLMASFTLPTGCNVSNTNLTSSEKGFLAISDCGFRAFSADGKTWANQVADSGSLRAAAYGNGIIVVGGSIDASSGVRLIVSDDGKVWRNNFTSPGDTPIFNVEFANGKFYAFGSRKIFISADGISWSVMATPSYFYSVTYGNGQFVAYGNSLDAKSRRFYTSKDAVTWQENTQVQTDVRNVGKLIYVP